MLSQKRHGYFLMVVLFFAVNLFAQEEKIALQDCLHLALQNNIDIRVARYLPEIAEADILVAESPFDIYLTGGYEYERLDSRLLQEKKGLFTTGIGKRFLTGTEVAIEYGLEYRRNSDFEDTRELYDFLQLYDPTFYDEDLDIEKLWTSGVTLRVTQPVLRNFGFTANEALIAIAKKNVTIADYETQSHINNVLGQVEIAYWRWVLALKNKEVLVLSISDGKRYREYVEQEATRMEGVVLSDINEANVNVYAREERLITLEQEILVAGDQLKRLIFPFNPENPGQLSWEKPIAPAEEGRKAFDILEDPASNVQEALKYRPEIKLLEERKQALDIWIARNENLLLPRLDLIGSVTFLGEEEGTGRAISKGFNGDHYRWSAGVAFELPLGNLAARGELQKSKSQKSMLDVELHRLQYDICLQMREAEHAVSAARQRYEKSVETLENAQVRLESLERRYKNPLPGDFNVIYFLQDAELKRTEASLARNQALFEYKVALVQLKVAEARYLKNLAIQAR